MDLIKLEAGKDWEYDGMALTLPIEVFPKNTLANVETTETSDSGWTITASISEDYYYWINEFKATHPTYGTVKGDFENIIYCTSKEAFDHFYENHTPESWDYQDI